MAALTKDKARALLWAHQDTLRSYGVQRCGLFGSVVRNEAGVESDVDVLIEFIPGRKNFSNFINVAFFLEGLFERRVDLLTRESLSPYIAPTILGEVEYVMLSA